MRHFRLIVVAWFCCAPAIAEEAQREKPDEFPKLESFPIKPKNKIDCGEDCDSVYQLPPEQLDRLREIEGNTPGMFIPLAPDKDARPKSRNKRSGF